MFSNNDPECPITGYRLVKKVGLSYVAYTDPYVWMDKNNQINVGTDYPLSITIYIEAYTASGVK